MRRPLLLLDWNGSITVCDKFKQQLGLLRAAHLFRFIETLPRRFRI